MADNADGDFEVDLISVVHLADPSYYHQLQADSAIYDRYLYELITSETSTAIGADGLRRVTADMQPTEGQVALARSYGLAPQMMCLDLRRHQHWVLADMSRERLQALQRESGEAVWGERLGIVEHMQEVGKALVVGRTADGRVLPKFFLTGGLNASALALRALMWLMPCPEAQVMLLDWARAWPAAGGVSAVLSAVIDRVLAGDIATAKKLAFAQQLVSGQRSGGGSTTSAAAASTSTSGGSSGGSGGGSADVLMTGRNAEVMRELRRSRLAGLQRVGVMYGCLHMRDLQERLRGELGMDRVGVRWVTAWDIPIGPATANQGRPAAEEARRWATVAGAALAYTAVGAWDWSDTFLHVSSELERGLSTDAAGAAAGAIGLYVLRHVYLYYGLAKW
ncbi:hypothetical protein JKP88DRAFT_352559 [Tribonema minus]|uniref:Uncharacterized protein n=1 Tax=Tribonema minus TaxID=303371 RepID=A0A835ZAI6_9STRA|nr:hypothetical protein JKP88DRAFT_352559 [Tribonema minus]